MTEWLAIILLTIITATVLVWTNWEAQDRQAVRGFTETTYCPPAGYATTPLDPKGGSTNIHEC